MWKSAEHFKIGVAFFFFKKMLFDIKRACFNEFEKYFDDLSTWKN